MSPRTKRTLMNVVKAAITVGGFWLLLTHPVSLWVDGEGGGHETAWPSDVSTVTVDGAPLAEVDAAAFDAGAAGWSQVDGSLRVRAGAGPLGEVVVDGHPVRHEVAIGTAVRDHIGRVDAAKFVWFSLLAMAVKFVGVLASAYAWHLLLVGQGVRYPYWRQIVTSFLIGRFIGTFMPGTIGLDGWTLYEAGRYSNEWTRVTTAKALEKFMGVAGLFSGLILTLPAGYVVLVDLFGDRGLWLAALIGAVSVGMTLGVTVGLAKPVLIRVATRILGPLLPGFVRGTALRFADAATAYDGKPGVLIAALFAKFVTHFTTAVVYYFTALAIGVVGAEFVPIVFGSLIQIFGTLFAPTIAGEGAREAMQALLLSDRLGGAAQAVLSAALGFIAAEAATLWGGAFLWVRTPSFRPAFTEIDGRQVDYAWLTDDGLGFTAALERVRARSGADPAP